MSVIEQTRTIDAPADEVFTYLADVSHVPRYFPDMTRAEPEGRHDDAHDATLVDVEGTMTGTRHEAEGWFRVDEGRHRIEWGSPENDRYHGWFAVEERGDGSSLTLNLTAPHLDDEAPLRDALDRIEREVGHTGDA
jgi:uncharacterized protein YndB with AHSA1/START domain